MHIIYETSLVDYLIYWYINLYNTSILFLASHEHILDEFAP